MLAGWGLAALAATVVVVYIALGSSAGVRTVRVNWSGATRALGSAGTAVSPSATTPLATGPLAVPARDHSMCPPTATACVDLTRHLTWMQSGGKVTFGPVWMEPGLPGSAHATPRGTFSVIWKGGPNVVSSIYGEPMPWAVAFSWGGIAFHAGSLTVPSHGCVHLTMTSARYYNKHLAIGAEVVVF